MTTSTLQLRDDLMMQLLQTTDDTIIKKLHKYYQRIVSRLQPKQVEEEEYISKEEILAGIDAGLKDMKAGRVLTMEEFFRELDKD